VSRVELDKASRTPIWVVIVVALWPLAAIAVLLVMLGPPAWR
jgi:hypothetical protein